CSCRASKSTRVRWTSTRSSRRSSRGSTGSAGRSSARSTTPARSSVQRFPRGTATWGWRDHAACARATRSGWAPSRRAPSECDVMGTGRATHTSPCPGGALPLLVDLREEVEDDAVPRLGLVAVREVARGGEDDELRAADLPMHHPHRRKRRVAVAADQEDGHPELWQVVGDVVHREQRAERVRVADRRELPVLLVELR